VVLGASVVLQEERDLAVPGHDAADPVGRDDRVPPARGPSLPDPLEPPFPLSTRSGEPGEETVALDAVPEPLGFPTTSKIRAFLKVKSLKSICWRAATNRAPGSSSV
jgi:hypothetical protein